MSAVAERPPAASGQAIGGTSWRAHVERLQEQALPAGEVVLTCTAALGNGGLGRHAQEIVDAFARRGQTAACICGAPYPPRAPRRLRRARRRALDAALSVAPLRLASAQRALRHNRDFDAYAAARLPAAEHLLAFNGSALEQLRAAKRAGASSTALVSATSHFRLLARQHELAHRQYPLEDSWAKRLLARNLSEYAEVDRIYVSSSYIHDSFIAEGFSEDVLARFPLTPDPRYAPAGATSRAGTFNVVFVGSLSVVKGVPLLVDAVSSLPHADMRLVLVGGWKSRGMRRFIEAACARDSRITAGHGDPAPHLRAARLYVHPTYNDGFGYAAAEALACGVPVIVSEDAGVKELISPGHDGVIVPTGDLDALAQAIDAAYRGELLTRARASGG